jgi:hypothetical protein
MSPRLPYLKTTLRTGHPLERERDRVRRTASRDSDADARRGRAFSDARHHATRLETSDPVEWSEARSTPRLPVSGRPTAGAMLDQILVLIGVVPVYGFPVLLVAGPWLLFALMLAGPFAVLVTLVVVLVAAAVLVGLIGAILAAPFLLVRHLRRYLSGHVLVRAPAGQLVVGESR